MFQFNERRDISVLGIFSSLLIICFVFPGFDFLAFRIIVSAICGMNLAPLSKTEARICDLLKMGKFNPIPLMVKTSNPANFSVLINCLVSNIVTWSTPGLCLNPRKNRLHRKLETVAEFGVDIIKIPFSLRTCQISCNAIIGQLRCSNTSVITTTSKLFSQNGNLSASATQKELLVLHETTESSFALLMNLCDISIEITLNLWRHYGVGKVEFGKPAFNRVSIFKQVYEFFQKICSFSVGAYQFFAYVRSYQLS
jgi:hypothetical protein